MCIISSLFIFHINFFHISETDNIIEKKKSTKLTPLMRQYFDVKRKHPDAILLFRVGDFYETFGEDAVEASHILGIVLTSRNNGGSDIELAGFPHHSLDVYLPKLVKAGYRVAICEQLEKPSKEKKIVKRDVTELVTPGVTSNETLLDSGKNNFLASVYIDQDQLGIAFLDISTGEFYVQEGDIHSARKLIQSFEPNEVIYHKSQKQLLIELIPEEIYTFGLEDWYFEADYNRQTLIDHFKVTSLKGLGLENKKLSQIAAGTILHYLSTIQQKNISHIYKINHIQSDKYMWLDRFTIRNLELIRSNHESGRSLMDVIDNTITPMGARLLNKWLALPLKSLNEIKERHSKVRAFIADGALKENCTTSLKSIGDLERLASKIPLGKINPREFIVIKSALEKIIEIKTTLLDSSNASIRAMGELIDPCVELIQLITSTLKEDAPVSLKKGQVISEGFSDELDEWRSISTNGKDMLLELQVKESKATGITNLKVGYNNVFGYYLEVTNKYKGQDLIPDNWIRKQTLKGSERYITPELKDLESKILQAQENIERLEEELFTQLILKSQIYLTTLLKTSQIIGELDIYICFASNAIKSEYVEPEMDESLILDIKSGRHPVIEKQLPEDKPYVPNDVYLDQESQQIIMITGPNMSGKSAVLRQTALIALLAHIGSFVPAKSARIGIIDKIFTRVGASDNISSGESTFMVEMNETASILNNLSARSLILLDEIGRGTSTYDGISIAWAIAEYLHEQKKHKAKTLFATHYHELNQLADSYPRIKNYNVSTKEVDDKVIFLRKLIPGSCHASFGIHVAQMAGMPKELVNRANDLLKDLESKSLNEESDNNNKGLLDKSNYQLNIFDLSSAQFDAVKDELSLIDVTQMTPIECMLKLKELSEKIKGN